ncbi:sodium-independent anion transporter [Thiohalobacter sp. IOR34]|uniref:sodium-independent anion transporter n=1 Tax=Thiohalobacter sp. IOR34 TaxID=3057176 RepID=UPI0025AF163F|nr:sodium-independent anion transporter [Thiohalobacter sp. IOR34]WJW76816.1 sodium-independent anion transporter [Thiohalobacter sp. IOR34]
MVRQLAAFDQYDVLVMDLTDVPAVDFTSTRAIEDMISDAQTRQRCVFLAGLRPRVRQFLQDQGILDKLAADRVLESRQEALCRAAKELGLSPETCNGRDAPGSDQPY